MAEPLGIDNDGNCSIGIMIDSIVCFWLAVFESG
jgi:hypothetical protein